MPNSSTLVSSDHSLSLTFSESFRCSPNLNHVLRFYNPFQPCAGLQSCSCHLLTALCCCTWCYSGWNGRNWFLEQVNFTHGEFRSGVLVIGWLSTAVYHMGTSQTVGTRILGELLGIKHLFHSIKCTTFYNFYIIWVFFLMQFCHNQLTWARQHGNGTFLI